MLKNAIINKNWGAVPDHRPVNGEILNNEFFGGNIQGICDKLGFDSLGYQSLDGLLEAIGIDKEKVCTYCWTGKE